MTRTPYYTGRPDQDYLGIYIREIQATALLTADEERQLAYRIEEGDAEARESLARANLRLVVNIARGYAGKGLGLQDLIEEGNLGLLRAVEGFDPSMNTRFSTYASFWIRQSIRRALVNTAKTIRIPSYMVELLSKWRRASAKLQAGLGRTPTQDEIARELNFSNKKLKIIQKAIRIYNAVPQSEELDAGPSPGEMLTDNRTKEPSAGMVEADDLRQVLALLAELDERSATVVRLRFGLHGEDPMTFKEIGERLGLTRERVRQIEGEALCRIRERLEIT